MGRNSYLKESAASVLLRFTCLKPLALLPPASLVFKTQSALEVIKSAQFKDTGDLTPCLKPFPLASILMDVSALFLTINMSRRVLVERGTLVSSVVVVSQATLAILGTSATSVLLLSLTSSSSQVSFSSSSSSLSSQSSK